MTRRSNEDRLGMPAPGAQQSGEAPAVIDAISNPAPNSNQLSYVVPTEIVELPSKGHFYPEGSSLHGVGEVEIKEMTAREEDILTTESFLKKGILFDRLLRSLIVNKSIKTEELLVGDRNALLVAARISAYGALYETAVSCPLCGYEDKDHNFDLSECPNKGPVDLESEDADLGAGLEYGGGATYLVTLPKSGMVVEVRLLNGKDEQDITRAAEMRRKKKLPENALTEHFKRVVVSVNGVSNPLEKESFISSMPASDSRFLRKAFKKLTPNIDLRQEFVCATCDHE